MEVAAHYTAKSKRNMVRKTPEKRILIEAFVKH